MSGPGRSGVLAIAKAAGVTSFDVVAAVRRQLCVKRVGHGGTLDPDATGVLPVLIGEATKLMPYLVDQDKEYVATLRFGITTDTHDLSGRVLSEAPVPPLTRAALENACRPFVGRIMQVPPMYSAVHHGGKRLYQLARAGVAVERRPRPVVIRSIAIEDVAGPRATLRVVSGKGTYVRVLAADLGAILGCGAAVEHLERSRVGPFDLAAAVPWSEVAGTGPALWSRVRPPETALGTWPRVELDRRAALAFRHGQTVEVEPEAAVGGGLVRVHEDTGAMIGVGEFTADGRKVKPVRILHADDSRTRGLPA